MSPADAVDIKLPDGSQREYPRSVTAAEVAASIGKRLAKDAIAAKVDGEPVDLDRPIDHDAAVTIVTPDTPDGREVLRHSTAHVMAQAVTDLFPGARYAIGPSIADGFYYDFELPDGRHFTEDDLGRIEARIREIVAADEPFVRAEVDREEGLRLFADQPYKVEIIERAAPEDASEVGEGTVISVYRNPRDGNGAFVDLCRGPHVPSTKRLGAFKLIRVAGRVLAGRREAPDAPAHLRHGVGVPSRARRAPAPARGGGATRPPQARRRARSLLLPGRDRLGPGGVPSEGRHGPPADGGLLASATSRPGTSSSPHRTSRRRTCSTPRVIWSGSPTACSRRWSSTRAPGTT